MDEKIKKAREKGLSIMSEKPPCYSILAPLSADRPSGSVAPRKHAYRSLGTEDGWGEASTTEGCYFSQLPLTALVCPSL